SAMADLGRIAVAFLDAKAEQKEIVIALAIKRAVFGDETPLAHMQREEALGGWCRLSWWCFLIPIALNTPFPVIPVERKREPGPMEKRRDRSRLCAANAAWPG